VRGESFCACVALPATPNGTQTKKKSVHNRESKITSLKKWSKSTERGFQGKERIGRGHERMSQLSLGEG